MFEDRTKTQFISLNGNSVEIIYFPRYSITIECFNGMKFLTLSIFPSIEKLWRA